MTTKTNSASSTDDLLDFFDSLPISPKTVFQENDLQFCEEEQRLLYETLNEIERWYNIFHEEAEQYREAYRLSYSEDGKVNFTGYFNGSDSLSPKYRQYEFKPFDVINQLVENRIAAIRAFERNIISYFNKTCHVSVPVPEEDKKSFPLDFRPVYKTYTSLIEQHLQGKGFRQTAEEELIQRFHSTVHCGYWKKKLPEQIKDKIIFYDVIRFDEFYFQYNRNKIHYSYIRPLEIFCEGIAFGSQNRLGGDSGIIDGFKSDDTNITEWYNLSVYPASGIKFYKNGRIDIRFADAASAKDCFNRLQLNEITLNNE
jgi:hypothetical protein